MEAVAFFFEADLFLLLDYAVGVPQLLPLILDLFLVLAVFLQDQLFLLLHDFLFLGNNLLHPILYPRLHLLDLILLGLLGPVEHLFQTFVFVVHLLDSEFVLNMLFLEYGDFVLLLFDLNLALCHLFDELLILVLELYDLLDFCNVFSFHYLVFDGALAVLVPFDHQGLQKNIDFVDVIQLRKVLFQKVLRFGHLLLLGFNAETLQLCSNMSIRIEGCIGHQLCAGEWTFNVIVVLIIGRVGEDYEFSVLVDQLILIHALNGLFLFLSLLDRGQLRGFFSFLLFLDFDDGDFFEDLGLLSLFSILADLLIELCVWIGDLRVDSEHVLVDGVPDRNVAHFEHRFSQEAWHRLSPHR